MGRGLSGAVVAITGGARGIGLATAQALARRGARVALGDLDGRLAAERAAELSSLGPSGLGPSGLGPSGLGPSGLGLPLDVTEEESFAEFLTTVTDQLGPPDILVNSAGVAVIGEFLKTSPDEHALQVAVNVNGVLRGMRLALPAMVARGSGHMINLASAAGRIPAPNAAVYSATKHAIVGATEAVRSELHGSGVQLTTVLPTFVDTEMAAGLRTSGIPHVHADEVARVIVDVIGRRRAPAVVTVPRWFAAVFLLDAMSPRWVRDQARRAFTVRTVPQERQRYQERVARQAADSRAEEEGDHGAEDGGGVLHDR